MGRGFEHYLATNLKFKCHLIHKYVLPCTFFSKNEFLIFIVREFQIHISKWEIILENYLNTTRNAMEKIINHIWMCKFGVSYFFTGKSTILLRDAEIMASWCVSVHSLCWWTECIRFASLGSISSCSSMKKSLENLPPNLINTLQYYPVRRVTLHWLEKCWSRIQLSPNAGGTAEFKLKSPPRLSFKQSEFINSLLTGILIRNQCFFKDIQYQDPGNYTFCLAIVKKELKSWGSTNLELQTSE